MPRRPRAAKLIEVHGDERGGGREEQFAAGPWDRWANRDWRRCPVPQYDDPGVSIDALAREILASERLRVTILIAILGLLLTLDVIVPGQGSQRAGAGLPPGVAARSGPYGGPAPDTLKASWSTLPITSVVPAAVTAVNHWYRPGGSAPLNV